MALSPNLQLLALIAIGTWVLLMVVALIRLRGVPIESKTNEMPKLMILASSTAGAVTLTATVLARVFFPQFLQESSASLYTAGFLGAAILLWWTFAVFWRETKLFSAQVSQPPIPEMGPKKHVESGVIKSRTPAPVEARTSPTDIMMILMALRGGKVLSSREIFNAAKLSVSLPTFLSILSRLVQDGFVMRTFSGGRIRYTLTTHGEGLVQSSPES